MGREVDLSVVIPVYDEEDSLRLLWPEIRQVLEPTRLRYEVIFTLTRTGAMAVARFWRWLTPPSSSLAISTWC